MCDELGDRLSALAKSLGKEDQELAQLGGISKETLSGYKSGRAQPRFGALLEWCKNTGVNANWLLLGEGPMFRDQIQTLADPIAQRVEAVGRTMRESGAAEADILKAIRAMIDGEIAKAGPATEPDPAPTVGSASA
ncbi:helix-turn-helix domain-containing protein [Desulfovibrio aminophilus]|uniref:helix-turn-helix domain-containing protein n=1 Tax=Desulfovibrio aminophilus TaxID=81425 RepID=UPI0009FFF81F|nr:helix-turn-helix transcriptional regulator [Desulfovibrio aminophilus]